MFYGYILKSLARKTFYIGHTDNVERRLVEHNTGQSVYTKNRGPWELVFQREFATRAAAMKWEGDLKRRKSRKAVEELVNSWMIGSVG